MIWKYTAAAVRTDADQLHLRARQHIRNGVLPRMEPTKTWVGSVSGPLCSLYDTPILETQIEYEIAFEWMEGDTRHRETYLFHESCHRIWRHERDVAA